LGSICSVWNVAPSRGPPKWVSWPLVALSRPPTLPYAHPPHLPPPPPPTPTTAFDMPRAWGSAKPLHAGARGFSCSSPSPRTSGPASARLGPVRFSLRPMSLEPDSGCGFMGRVDVVGHQVRHGRERSPPLSTSHVAGKVARGCLDVGMLRGAAARRLRAKAPEGWGNRLGIDLWQHEIPLGQYRPRRRGKRSPEGVVAERVEGSTTADMAQDCRSPRRPSTKPCSP